MIEETVCIQTTEYNVAIKKKECIQSLCINLVRYPGYAVKWEKRPSEYIYVRAFVYTKVNKNIEEREEKTHIYLYVFIQTQKCVPTPKG